MEPRRSVLATTLLMQEMLPDYNIFLHIDILHINQCKYSRICKVGSLRTNYDMIMIGIGLSVSCDRIRHIGIPANEAQIARLRPSL